MKNPYISIITATYNAEKYLPTLTESIRNQNSKNFQFLIIDGGSKDSTLQIIERNKDIVNYWSSEPDHGIYDAWNKGLSKATGDWIMFLGSDDILLPGTLKLYSSFIENLKNREDIDLISSKVQMIDTNGKPIRIKGWKFQWPHFLKEMTIAHPGALHSRNLFNTYGVFNTDYKIVGDYELLLRAGKNLNAAFLDEVTVKMSEGGMSDSVAAIKEQYLAVTITGKLPIYKALFNAAIVYMKFKMKKLLRFAGFNFYLKK